MKRLFTSGIISCLFLLVSFVVSAQIVKPDTTSHWKKKLIFNVNVNQAAFSSNWKAGGINSIGLNTSFNYKANYDKNKTTWDNEVDLLYGFVNNSGQGFRKTLDRIYLDTKVGHKLSDKWSLFTSLNLLTQFATGYRFDDDDNAELISDFMAPAFITSAWGMQYKPADFFFVRMSPFAPRVTIVNDNNGRFNAVDVDRPYGVTVGEPTRYEWLAFQLLADFDKEIAKNITLKSRYIMFMNYEELELKTIDHRLEFLLTAS